MKAEEILQKNANKTMKHWELNSFKITHPTLYKAIIDSINEAINYTRCCMGEAEQLKAVEKLKDFAYEVCPLHREDDLEEIVGRL